MVWRRHSVTSQVITMLYLIHVKLYSKKTIWFSCPLTLTWCTDSGVSSCCCGFGNMGRSRHKSFDQSAALSHAVTPLPVWLLLVQHVFMYFSLFYVSSKIYWVKITYALFDHCRHHGTVLRKKKKMWGKKYDVCWPSSVKNFSNIIIIRKDFKNVAFSCTKEKFMERASTVGNVLLCWTW